MADIDLVVGLGSSAGGLAALTEVFGALPPDLPVAYVLAQHARADPASPLIQLLQKGTRLQVQTAEEGDHLEAGVVLVCPPSQNVAVEGSTLHLSDATDATRPSPSVDLLFDSLAESWGSAAVGLLLSGTGSDGVQGLTAMRAHGGVALAQSPASAEFPAMPQSAINSGCVDKVIQTNELADVLRRLLPTAQEEGPATSRSADSGNSDGPEQADHRVPEVPFDTTSDVLDIVRQLTNLDFSGYKANTIERQLARRRAVLGVGADEYRDVIEGNADEAWALTGMFLVPVTSFFREPPAWDRLQEALAREWSTGPADEERRVWVPGCATGEEAYSVAMVALEALGVTNTHTPRLKVFATDLREDVLEVGRNGRYPAAAVSRIPGKLRDRWWRQEGAEWTVAPVLREMIVFARHDVTRDPPFPRLDLISFRNTLIYMDAELQQRALRLLRYALLDRGLLFLGASERISDQNPLFTRLDDEHHIYRAAGQTHPGRLPIKGRPAPSQTPGSGPSVERQLLSQLVDPSLVCDLDGNVIDIVGDVSRWCWVAPGPPSAHVVALLREEFRLPVETLLIRLRHGSESSARMLVPSDSGATMISAQVLGIQIPGTIVVTFHEGDETSPGAPQISAGASDATGGADVLAVTRELEQTRSILQRAIEDVNASNEELRALNEELQASSEEAESANEELQASNEELSTLNQELQARTDALTVAQRDLENIQTSASSGWILLDKDARITRFSAPAVRVFGLIDADIGRELARVPTTVPISGLATALRAAVTLGESTLANLASDESDFLVQVHPYRSHDAQILGAVVVVTDVSDLTEARAGLALALGRLEAIADALPDMVWQRSRDGRLLYVSNAVERVYGLRREQVLKDPELLNAAVVRSDRDRVTLARSAADPSWDIEFRITLPGGTQRWLREFAAPTSQDAPTEGLISGFVRDITESAQTRRESITTGRVLDAVLSCDALMVVLLDPAGRIVKANAAFAKLTGRPVESLLGVPFESFESTESADESASSRGGKASRLNVRSGAKWVLLETIDVTSPLDDSGPTPSAAGEGFDLADVATVVVGKDLTPAMDVETQLRAQVRYDQQTGVFSRAEFHRKVSEDLARARARHETFAVLWIDLDRFKATNDTHGHRAGDHVLEIVAARLRTTIRREDFIGRLGGDEFGVVIHGLDSADQEEGDDLEVVVDRMLHLLEEPIETGESVVFVTGSVGIAIAPADGIEAAELLHNADSAMYSAKESGGNTRVYFRTEMNERAKARGAQRQRLAGAVRQAEFLLHYQPIIEASTGDLSMLEGLLRWQHEDTITTAEDFLEEARSAGLLKSIGAIGRDTVAADLAALGSIPDLVTVPVTINVSTEELDRRDLIQQFLAWNPEGERPRVFVEVTEQSLTVDNPQAMELLRLLKRLGTPICIDDFGSGYSNISMLAEFQPNYVKLDRSLTNGAEKDDRKRGLLRAAVDMIRALGATTVLEGVENADQLQMAKDIRADLVQGYFLARPMNMTELERWMAERQWPPR